MNSNIILVMLNGLRWLHKATENSNSQHIMHVQFLLQNLLHGSGMDERGHSSIEVSSGVETIESGGRGEEGEGELGPHAHAYGAGVRHDLPQPGSVCH